MIAIALAGPAVEPVSLADLKTYLRVDGTAEDTLLASLIAAARTTIEGATRLALVAQSWRVSVSNVPGDGRVALPLWPVLSVEAVRIVAGGTTTQLSTTDYRLERNGDPVVLVVTATVGVDAVLEVDLTAGFGTGAADPPPTLRLAIQRLAARWYGARGDGIPAGDGPLDSDILSLVAPFRRPRLA